MMQLNCMKLTLPFAWYTFKFNAKTEHNIDAEIKPSWFCVHYSRYSSGYPCN